MLEAVGDKVELTGTEVKPDVLPPSNPDDLLKELNDLGDDLRALIVRSKNCPKDKTLASHQDETRALSLAQSHLQTGFMWMRRAIKPEKVF